MIKKIWKEKNSDWVYSSTYPATIAAVILKPFLKYKLCHHYHVSEIPNNSYRANSRRYFTQKAKILIIKLLHYFFLNFVDIIIVPSKFSKKDILNNYKLLNKKRIKIIINGVENRFFKRLSPKALKTFRDKININDNELIIAYVGRLEEHKNVKSIVDTINILKKVINVRLLLIYSKPNNICEIKYKNELIKMSRDLDIDDKIVFIQNPKNVPAYYQISDFIILPSETEQMPLVMLEAFASRKLFLATSVGGIKEVLNKVSKELIITDLNPNSVAKKVLRLAKLKGKKKMKIVEKEYDFVKNLSWDKVAQQIYLSLVDY